MRRQHHRPAAASHCTHLWGSARAPAEDPLASDVVALHQNRERVLQVAQLIVPGHGAPFRPDESTTRQVSSMALPGTCASGGKLIVQTPVTPQQRQMAKREIVQQVEQGTTVSDARRLCPAPMHRTILYRLLKRTQREGEQAFSEGRHGHPVKLRGEILAFLLDYCRSHPSAKSAEVQHLLAERFGLSVSVSQLNRVRAAHGLSRQSAPREKKPKTGMVIEIGSHEQSGGLLLLAAATETGLLSQLEQALSSPPVPPAPACLPLASSPQTPAVDGVVIFERWDYLAHGIFGEASELRTQKARKWVGTSCPPTPGTRPSERESSREPVVGETARVVEQEAPIGSS